MPGRSVSTFHELLLHMVAYEAHSSLQLHGAHSANASTSFKYSIEETSFETARSPPDGNMYDGRE